MEHLLVTWMWNKEELQTFLSAPEVQDCQGEAQLQQSSWACGSPAELRTCALQEQGNLDMFLFSEFSIVHFKQQNTAWYDFLPSNCDFLPSLSNQKTLDSPNSYSRREDDTGVEATAKQHQSPVTKATQVMGKTRYLCSFSLCPGSGKHGGGFDNSILHSVA